jgi:2',3'-cyclic-nucleotide 2'-phosphodiesterase (5'-nucleotidase family)
LGTRLRVTTKLVSIKCKDKHSFMFLLSFLPLSFSAPVEKCKPAKPVKCPPVKENPKQSNVVTILHTNDIHAHLDEFNHGGTFCSKQEKASGECYGGVARIKTIVDQYRQKSPNVLLLDAGDEFTGTLFFQVFKTKPIAEFMNIVKYDAMTIGNHEFDKGQAALVDFLADLKFPVLSSNIDFSKSLLNASNVKPYHIYPQHKLAVIGFILKGAAAVSSNVKDVTFMDPVPVVQKYVNDLHAQGIKRIICLSHNGYQDDMDLAARTSGINLIVGGHSHTLLLKNSTVAKGPYTTQVKNLDGKVTHIVQAHRYGNYVGRVDVEWDASDELVGIQGEPILLDQSVKQNEELQAKVQLMKKDFEPLINDIVATALEEFKSCRGGNDYECPLAELVADCLLEDKSYEADASFQGYGGLRAGFTKGAVSAADLFTMLPFGNTNAYFDVTGKELFDLIEGLIQKTNLKTGNPITSAMQFGNLQYTLKKDVKPSLQSVTIKGQPLDLKKSYKIVGSDFNVKGGDNFLPTGIVFKTGKIQVDVVTKCLRTKGKISPQIDGRVKEIK